MRRSKRAVDKAALVAVGVILVGWFLLATLTVDFGLWQQGVRFYDVWAVIADPAGRLSGINRSHGLATIAFALVCAAAILAPARSAFYQRKDAGLTYLIPLVVMVISCAVLYAKTCTYSMQTQVRPDSASAWLAQIAQAAVGRAGGAVATRISIGAGAYLAMLGSCFLALRGVRRLRAAVPRVAPRERSDT